jgi:hypothetical protein
MILFIPSQVISQVTSNRKDHIMLETSISELQAAVIRLTQVIEAGLAHVNTPAAPAPAAVVPPAPAPVAALPVAPAAPVVVPVFTAPAAPMMPPPPVFASAPAAAAPTLPFSDSTSLVAYVMGVYKAIGPQKGAGIQNVLTSLGVVNLTDVKPDQYAAFYAGVEALKA